MPKCEWCDTEFDTQEAKDIFENEFSLMKYDNIRKCLCGSCAIQAIEDQVDGIYFETCEECGKDFDFVEECSEFEDNVDGTSLTDWWNYGILCCDCALGKI